MHPIKGSQSRRQKARMQNMAPTPLRGPGFLMHNWTEKKRVPACCMKWFFFLLQNIAEGLLSWCSLRVRAAVNFNSWCFWGFILSAEQAGSNELCSHGFNSSDGFLCVWKRNETNSTLSSANSEAPILCILGAVCVPCRAEREKATQCPCATWVVFKVSHCRLVFSGSKTQSWIQFFVMEELSVSPLM